MGLYFSSVHSMTSQSALMTCFSKKHLGWVSHLLVRSTQRKDSQWLAEDYQGARLREAERSNTYSYCFVAQRLGSHLLTSLKADSKSLPCKSDEEPESSMLVTVVRTVVRSPVAAMKAMKEKHNNTHVA